MRERGKKRRKGSEEGEKTNHFLNAGGKPMVEELQTLNGSVFHDWHIVRLDQETPQIEMKL